MNRIPCFRRILSLLLCLAALLIVPAAPEAHAIYGYGMVMQFQQMNSQNKTPEQKAKEEMLKRVLEKLEKELNNMPDSSLIAEGKKITGAILPEPKSFFNDEIKFTTTPSNSTDFGTMTTGDFKYKDLALAQEYVQCIVDHYPFTLDTKIKSDMSSFNASWNWYTEGCFFNYTGGDTKNVGSITLYHYNNASANACVDFNVDPGSDLVRLTIYYGDNISFRDNGYRCSGKLNPVPTPTHGSGTCYFCGGTGEKDCDRCGGRGQIQEYQTTYSFGKKQQVLQWVDCPDCMFGRVPCPWCS